MKPLIRTIFIWILSLSLTGLPVVALSQNLAGDMLGLSPSEKSMMMKVSNESGDGMRCHAEMSQKNISQTDIAQTNITQAGMQSMQHAMHMSGAENKTSMDGCCGADCKCQSDMNCQSVTHFGATALLQSTLFTSSPLKSQTTTESITLYRDRDADSEVIPPIA